MMRKLLAVWVAMTLAACGDMHSEFDEFDCGRRGGVWLTDVRECVATPSPKRDQWHKERGR